MPDKACRILVETKKLPPLRTIGENDLTELMLPLFRALTEEELGEIEDKRVPLS
ncbi:MAG: hypothetical protein LBP22_00940 [Deltaproteobacteria bacterium]|nr:hypothetical protein [Deltaproteobacteria bacterium]